MKNLLALKGFCAFLTVFILTFNCAQIPDETTEPGELIELTDDGGWGYAGHHAYIVNNKLFVSYIDQAGSRWVASYDFESGEIIRNNIWDGIADLHNSNPLIIRPDGRIQVFINKGQGAYVDKRIKWKVSVEPWSIDKFGELQESELEADILQGRQFYPLVHQASGEMYLIINARRGEEGHRETVMWKSPDGGDTWTEYYNLWGLGKGLSSDRCYTRAYIKGDEIHFVTLRVGWNELLAGHEIGRVEGVYYTKYNVRKETFYHADDSQSFSIADTPVYETEYFDKIWHWHKDGGKRQRALWSDIVADTSGKPYVAFAILQDAVPGGRSIYHEGYWSTPNEDGEWNYHKVATLARGWDNKPERKNYAIAIDPEDPETLFVSMSTSKEEDLSQVHRLQTHDDGKTWETSAILSGEGRLTTVVVPRVLDQSSREVDVLWLNGRMEEWRDFETKVMMFRKGIN
jgi:hypothetical protein